MRRRITTSIMMLAFTTFFVNPSYGQQTKRNIIGNGDFEKGLKNWRTKSQDGARVGFSADDLDPISGNSSLKAYVEAKLPDDKNWAWNGQAYYKLGLKKGVAYKVMFTIQSNVESKIRIEMGQGHDDNTPIEMKLGSGPKGFYSEWTSDEWDVESLRGTIDVGTTKKTYVFYTKPWHLDSDSECQISFQFARSEVGSYWVDDVKISHADETDWDGNLLPTGDFETKVPNQNGAEVLNITLKGGSEGLDSWNIDENAPISGNKSLHIKRQSGNRADAFWDFALQCVAWHNEETDTEVSFKARSSKETQITVRTNSLWPWDVQAPAGDALILNPTLAQTNQTFILNKDTKNDGSGKNTGNFTYDRWNTETTDKDFRTNHDGSQTVFFSFVENTAEGAEIWIDDLEVREYGLKLEDFEVVNAPKSVNVDQTIQFTIGEFVTPTHAPSTVIFGVENGTGEASIDQDGILKGIKSGKVIVKISTPDGSKVKTFEVTISGESSIDETSAEYSIYPTAVIAGEKINIELSDASEKIFIQVYNTQGVLVKELDGSNYIETDNLSSGVYFIRISVQGKESIERFIVK